MSSQNIDALLEKGIQCVKARQLAEALEWFNKAVELYPANRYSWQNKGFALEEMGRLVEATDCFEKMLELNQKDSEAWAWKAEALLCQDKYVEAISCFDKAISLSPLWEFPIEARKFALEQLDRKKFSHE